MGRVALATVAPERYGEIAINLSGAKLIEQERIYFTTDHVSAGCDLARQWRFPGVLQQAMRHYVQPEAAEGAARPLASMVAVAALAATVQGGLKLEDLVPYQACLDQIGLKPETVISVAEKLKAS